MSGKIRHIADLEWYYTESPAALGVRAQDIVAQLSTSHSPITGPVYGYTRSQLRAASRQEAIRLVLSHCSVESRAALRECYDLAAVPAPVLDPYARYGPAKGAVFAAVSGWSEERRRLVGRVEAVRGTLRLQREMLGHRTRLLCEASEFCGYQMHGVLTELVDCYAAWTAVEGTKKALDMLTEARKKHDAEKEGLIAEKVKLVLRATDEYLGKLRELKPILGDRYPYLPIQRQGWSRRVCRIGRDKLVEDLL